MTQARIMSISLDRHMNGIEASIASKSVGEKIAFYEEVIKANEKAEGWFGPALANRVRWVIKKLEAQTDTGA